ncbi:unnamed protein product [Boreogadus saida]
MTAMKCARAALGMNMPSHRSACVGIMRRCRLTTDSAEPTLPPSLLKVPPTLLSRSTMPSLFVSSELDDSDRDEEVASPPASPLRMERPGAAALPVSAPHFQWLELWWQSYRALSPGQPQTLALRPYFSGAVAEPGKFGAPVKTFIQVTKTEGLTDRGYRAVTPLDPALCAVFGVKPGLSNRCPILKDQMTAKLTDRAHQCVIQQEAVMNNIALLAHDISTMAADPHRLAERAVEVVKTAGVILCLCSTGALAAARTAAWQHLIQRNLWLQQTPGIPRASPGHIPRAYDSHSTAMHECTVVSLPPAGGGCGQLDRATGHFWWERPPQATPNPDHRAAGADAAGADAAGADAARDDAARDDAAGDYAAGDYAARDDAARDDAARDDAARDEAAGDEAAGDEVAGVKAAGVEAAGDEVAGDEAAKRATPAAEAAMLHAGPPHLRKATRGFSKGWRSVATRPRPIKDIEST